jgi:glycosyltransferase involved in cell wall biosynthesis
VRALSDHASGRVQPVLFFGTDIDEKDVAPFELLEGVVVKRSPVFDETRKGERLRQALLSGCDHAAAEIFTAEGVDVVFEPAQFYGWRFPLPALAWIPDFQHRYLKNLFDFKAYWKREIGFRAQVLSGRHVMLSSDDARQDCERFFPSTQGRTHVVRFAVPSASGIDAVSARAVADGYGLPDTFFFLPNQFWKHKNHECVIQALQSLKAKKCEVVVAASGKQADPRDPEHFPKLQRLIEHCGLTENFRLLGLIPQEHIPALMRSCAALINPSTFEGWSTTVEEGKSMGTPMILSSLRVHHEQCGDALFFDLPGIEALADLMASFVPFDSIDRDIMFQRAAKDALGRTRKFAGDFSSLIERLAERK